jgi:hypothetical protein
MFSYMGFIIAIDNLLMTSRIISEREDTILFPFPLGKSLG